MNTYNDLTQELWKQMQYLYATTKMQILKNHQLTLNNLTMKFFYKQFGDKPVDGYSLIFGLHGGGQCVREINDEQFENHLYLYEEYLPQGCIWCVPRSCHDHWDMWHKDYLSDFLLEIVRAFALNNLINTNKVFLTGYSAGGDGVYHMGPRLADHLAGAAMMAGHPNGAHLFNLRNVAFSIQVGQHDTPYHRNQEAVKYIRMLNQLSTNYGGYEHLSKIHSLSHHWMKGKDAEIFKWLLSAVRNPYPNLILFKECLKKNKKQFYYLGLGSIESQEKEEQLMCFHKSNTFRIFSNRTVTVKVNRKMINPSIPIMVIHNGQMTCNRLMEVRMDVARQTMQERMDPYFCFEDQFISKPSKIINIKEAFCEIFSLSCEAKQAEYQQQLQFNQNVNSRFLRAQPWNLTKNLQNYK